MENATGEVIQTLRRGESILLTFRGKPLGTIRPIGADDVETAAVEPYEEAWAEIKQQLRRSRPRFPSWKKAEDDSRRRR